MCRTPILSKFVVSVVVVSAILVLSHSHCHAGMPYPLPDDVSTILSLGEEPKQRLQVISFFFVAFLLSALMVKFLWNGIRGEFQSLPRITYGRALLITFGWGLLFCIVLVMISGARELMTPGAWEKSGATYQLRGVEAEEVSDVP